MQISKKQLLNFILFLLLTAFQANAQNGKIAGKVVDKKTGEELIGVTVIIEGSSFGAATDYEGKFTISNVKPGTYNLIASFVSYGKKQIKDVEVKANEITPLSIVLERTTKELVEVIVQGTLKRENRRKGSR